MATTYNLEPKTSPLLVVVGETASGKTSLALELAKELNGEIICADSWTVRREVNIGTAKPTANERATIPHHLLDIVGPDEVFTAAKFKDLANEAIIGITNRGKMPILVGGTGLYIDGLLYDYSFLPESDYSMRDELNAMGSEELIAKIKDLGLDISDIDTQNKRRLIRLIETNGQQPERKSIRENTVILGIRTDRDELKIRIEKRVDLMIENGLESEVKGLADNYGWDCEALKGVGYSQWKDYFLHSQTLSETRQKIVKATLDLAKRQRTWFKRNKSIHWLEQPINREKTVALITTSLDT